MRTDRGSSHLGWGGGSAPPSQTRHPLPPPRPDTHPRPDIHPQTRHTHPIRPYIPLRLDTHPPPSGKSLGRRPPFRKETPPPWTEWMTHACEISTFRHTSYAVGNNAPLCTFQQIMDGGHVLTWLYQMIYSHAYSVLLESLQK